MRFSDFTEGFVELSYSQPDTLCSVTFTVPPAGADARVDVNLVFRRSSSGQLAAGYFVVKNGVYPTADRFFQAFEVTGQFFPATYVMYDEGLTPDSEVTYALVASKLRDNSEPVSAIICNMTVTLD